MGDLITRAAGPRNLRGLSMDMWNHCPRHEIREDPSYGWYFEDDFMDDHDLTNRYTATQASTGTFLITDAQGGVADADCNSGTVEQGINIQASSTVGERFIPVADAEIYFEVALKVTDSATGPEFFVGLHEIDTSIIASSALTGNNYIGWSSVTDDNVLLFSAGKAGTVTTLTSSKTLVEATYVNLAFRIRGVGYGEEYVDGLLKGETLTSTNIPIVAMVPSLVCQSNGTTDPIVSIDWWQCYQRYIS